MKGEAEVIVRDALKEEYPFVRELRLNAYQEYASKIPERHWEVLQQSILSDEDLDGGIERIVVEIEGEIVGSVTLFPPKIEAYKGLLEDELEYPELRMLAVSPNARGKGAAIALMTECLRRSKKKGFNALGLHTADFMENAVKLYEHLHFERLPDNDFQPLDDGIIVKAFVKRFNERLR